MTSSPLPSGSPMSQTTRSNPSAAPGLGGGRPPAVLVHQHPGDRQAQAQAAVPPCDGLFPLLERIEDPRQDLRLDADSRVGDLDRQPPLAYVRRAETDAAPRG